MMFIVSLATQEISFSERIIKPRKGLHVDNDVVSEVAGPSTYRASCHDPRFANK